MRERNNSNACIDDPSADVCMSNPRGRTSSRRGVSRVPEERNSPQDYRLSRMRPCVRELLVEGVSDEQLLKRTGARHFIIVELKRLGFSLQETQELLTDWNERNVKKIPPARLKNHLLSYADWLYAKDITKIGCEAIRYRGGCLSPDKDCGFRETLRRQNNKARQEDGRMEEFHEKGWPKYLEDYSQYGDCTLQTYLTLSTIQAERDLPPEAVIYVGCRKIARRMKMTYGREISPMQVCRYLNELAGLSLIEIASRGEWGTQSRRANGYKLLNVPDVPSVTDTNKAETSLPSSPRYS